jgi:hypothetical protein
LNAISPGSLFHLHDQLSGKHFLVDTGATYSVFPHRSSAPPSGPALTGPCGRAISTWGEREIPLSFDGQQFTWSFLLAAVQFPILGMDFLQQHGLLVDVGKQQLIMTASMKVIRAVAPSGGPGGLYTAVASPSTGYGPLFAEYVTQHKEESGKPAHRDGLHKGLQSGGPIWRPWRPLHSSRLFLNGVQTPLFAEYVTQHKEETGKPAHRDDLHEGHQSGGPIRRPRWPLQSSRFSLNSVWTPLC